MIAGMGEPVISSWPAWVRLPGDRSEYSDDKQYPMAKETKPKETGGRESERLIVPVMRGNPLQGTQRREGGVCLWNLWRER